MTRMRRWLLASGVFLLCLFAALLVVLRQAIKEFRHQQVSFARVQDVASALDDRLQGGMTVDEIERRSGNDLAVLLGPPYTAGSPFLLDDWGRRILVEVRNGRLLARSLGADGHHDTNVEPSECFRQIDPQEDIVLEVNRSGGIAYLKVPSSGLHRECKVWPYASFGQKAARLLGMKL